MQLALLLKREARGAPLWAWLLGLLPWIWIIPFNQYFWDDWVISSTTDFTWHTNYWITNGAKHFANPFIYPILIRLGPWSFALVGVGLTVLGGVALSEILVRAPKPLASVSAWAGPMFLVLPIFHARFSAAVFEYLFALVCLLIGWWCLLAVLGWQRWLLGLSLLIFAIGVPSLAVLFPVLFAHLLWRQAPESLGVLVKVAYRNIQVLLIPAIFAIVFSRVVNTKGKYKVSTGALLEFSRGLGALLILLVLGFLIIRRLGFENRRSWYWVSGLALLAYFGLFPYFAVGYNPLSDFLPWRMREEALDGLLSRIALTAVFLGVIAAAMLITVSRKLSRKEFISGLPTLVFVVGFGVIAVAVGPMDWESRHWLIAWPVLAVLVLALVATAQPSIHKTLVVASFAVFLASSLVISSEYLVDSLKQKAIIQAVDEQLRDVFPTVSDSDSSYAVVVELSRDTNMLNARYRTYRPYEWWGLIAEGLKVSPSSLRVFEGGDLELQSDSTCSSPFRAIMIQPLVTTSRLDSLTRMRVGIDLNAQPVELCSLAVKSGYPRDS